uniref:Malate dehydrogenase, cytoplasmic n=1 Tax=Hirondellea gigas TaxID=1518452 RepID=A0A6A7FZY2_9CRUS
MSEEKEPIRVVISGAAGQIGYALIPLVAGGKTFGPNQPIILHLLDIPPAMKCLGGVVMEIEDCAYPLVRGIVATDSYEVAFDKVDWAILVGGFPRKKGMLRKDLLAKNASIYIETGKVLDRCASKDCHVLVVANPANTNANTLSMNTPSIPRGNITALTRLDMNRGAGILAKRLGAKPSDVTNVTIFGNHSKTQFPYIDRADINGTPIRTAINDDSFLDQGFITQVQNRGAEVIAARGFSSAMSAANAIKDHVHDWFHGTKPGQIVSMGVDSTGNPYGIADGLIYSFPVTIKNREWAIVGGFSLTDAQRTLMQTTEKELKEEKDEVSASSNL